MSDTLSFSFFHRIRLLLAFILIALPFEAALAALIPLGVFFFAGGPSYAKDRDALYLMAGTLAGGAALGLLAGVFRDVLTVRARNRVLGRLRMFVFDRLQRMPFSTRGPAGLPPRLPGDIELLENAIAGAIPRAALPLVEAALCAGLLFWFDWRAGIAGLLFWPWIILTPALAAATSSRARAELKEEASSLFGLIRETIATLPVIRVYGLEQPGAAGFRKRNDSLSRSGVQTDFQIALMEKFAFAGALAIHLALFAVSALLVFGNRITTAAFAAIQILGFGIAASLQKLREYGPVLRQAQAARDRVEQLLEATDALAGTPADAPGARVMSAMRSEIGFSDVIFRYRDSPDREKYQIAGVSGRIPRGAYVAFTGPGGSGKSTLIGLLMRSCDPDSGRITIDGFDLRTVNRTSLRAQMGIVLRENAPVDGSIRDNIRLGKPDASAEAVMNAATAAGLHAQIMTLPDGYDTIIDTGLNRDADTGVRFFAGGLQRLALARAMLREPEIVLLDDVTLALDPAEEAALLGTIRNLRKGRTVIAAAHRLSTIADADHIFVLDGGAIVEQGNHADLLALDGMYTYLWRKQAVDLYADPGLQKLRDFPLFEHLEDAALAELAPLFATETFQPRFEIVRQGDPDDRFFILARGRAESRRAEEKRGEPAVLDDGDSFGDMTLLAGLPRTATIRATTVCTCRTLARSHFLRVLDRYPESTRRTLSAIAAQNARQPVKAAVA